MFKYFLSSAWFWLFYASVALMFVYIAQYGFGIEPCQLCHWQRLPWFGLAFISLLQWLRPMRVRLFYTLIMILGLVSLALSTYHSGIEYGLWQGPASCSGDRASQSLKNGMSMADLLAKAEASRIIPCDQPSWVIDFSAFKLSFAGLNILASMLWLGLIIYIKRLSKTHG